MATVQFKREYGIAINVVKLLSWSSKRSPDETGRQFNTLCKILDSSTSLKRKQKLLLKEQYPFIERFISRVAMEQQ